MRRRMLQPSDKTEPAISLPHLARNLRVQLATAIGSSISVPPIPLTFLPSCCFVPKAHMKILLTGATGYIGMRLLPVLIEAGHEIVACTRDRSRFEYPESYRDKVTVVEVDFLNEPDLEHFPMEFDAAYYLMHSMSASVGNFEENERRCAEHFRTYLDRSTARQIVYLTGIVPEGGPSSPHLESRLTVERILSGGKVPLTALRAGIIVGSGSASFEIIRDLVEKLPIMIAPKWLDTPCQPIAIRNVMEFLTAVLHCENCLGRSFDIGGADVLTYRQMLLRYAEVRDLKRWIWTVPVMTPRLSAYWLYFVTSTNYALAVNLVDSMSVPVVARNHELAELLGITRYSYKEAVRMAFRKIRQNMVVSSWRDSFVSSLGRASLEENMAVPKYGCFVDRRERPIDPGARERILRNIWSIGGRRGWYYGNWLWKLRGYLDKLVGGVGLRRGRTHSSRLNDGDALDFWRVLVANRERGRLLLYAEMKLPGDAWLEFNLEQREDGSDVLCQTATFRPHGIAGRLYWYAVLPFHHFIFNGMVDNLIDYREEASPAISSDRR